MRLITLALVILVVLIQYPLWLGKGGWLRVHELEHQVREQQRGNALLKARNDKLDAEVRDLRDGAGAVEERARYELGMIRDGEIFVQTVDAGHASHPVAATPGAAPGAAPLPAGAR